VKAHGSLHFPLRRFVCAAGGSRRCERLHFAKIDAMARENFHKKSMQICWWTQRERKNFHFPSVCVGKIFKSQ
jgi:hypothetical protein